MIFKIMKKGAMFGLDARIALAIFGALSVISGAALYSAIQQAKTESYRQTLEELVKASEQYYLDTGSYLSSLNVAPMQNLVYNRESLKNWKGPYISDFITHGAGSIKKSNFTRVFIYTKKHSVWSSASINSDEACVSGSPDCAEYIALINTGDFSFDDIVQIFNNLDNLVDNGDGALTGKVRLLYSDTGTSVNLYYKGITRRMS
jgi:Tfp pilus assembly protein PilE